MIDQITLPQGETVTEWQAPSYFALRSRNTTIDYGTKVNTIEEQHRIQGEM